MTTPVILEQRAVFHSKPFKAVAAHIWDNFLDLVDPSYDLMHWMVDGFSSTVRVTGRRIDESEYSLAWNPSRPIIVLVDGFHESKDLGKRVLTPATLEEFREWVEDGIMHAFKMKRIEKRFQGLGFPNGSFVIVTSPTDAGLAEDELRVIWTNNKAITPAQIKARQIAAQRDGLSVKSKKRKPKASK